MDKLHEKFERLKSYLSEQGSVMIAYSSGVDSTFLLKTAHDLLGDKAVAVTARSCSFPERELEETVSFCRSEGIEQIIIDTNELEIEEFCKNPKDRCYHCKKNLFSIIADRAAERGIEHICEGSNLDDERDYRPGLRAVGELGVLSPLRYAGLTKQDIRTLSEELGLYTFDKPSFACLASRFVYGERITGEKLKMVEQAEEKLKSLGFKQLRVRVHGDMARIELMKEDIPRAASPEISEDIAAFFGKLGFSYTSLDLNGYRTGSMNKGII